MLVRHCMSREVVTLEESDSCVDAYALFRSRGMRRAPVVREGSLVGMISDRDLLRALPWSLGEQGQLDTQGDLSHTVGTFMARNVISVTPETHLEDVARLMLEHKIGGLPVTEGGELVGIITESDILRVFVRLSLQGHATRITIQAPASRSDQEPDPVDACHAKGRYLSGLARYVSPAGTTMLTLHVSGPNADDVPEQLRRMGFVLVDVARSGRKS